MLMEDKSTHLVVYEHNEKVENIHCHVYIVTSIKPDAMKVRLKKYHPFSSTEWSFKTAQDDGCIRYMSKGVHEPKYCKGYTPEQISKFKSSWELKKPDQRVSQKATVSAWDMAMEVVEIAQSVSEDNITELYQACVKAAIQVHRKHKKAYCQFSLERVVETAFSQFLAGEISLTQRMLQKFSKQYT